ncbi:hypothetical protein G4228_009053 [Cervus hanglu yarkandensis]|nr:hypothetical protein G4228_009053 [Cervus hanglu yarkandensis]
MGFFMTGYLPLGFEFAVELTYPESEGMSSGLLNVSAQVFGIIFTISQGQIIDNYGTMPGNIFLCVFLTLGAVLTAFIKADLRRQDANKEIPENTPSLRTEARDSAQFRNLGREVVIKVSKRRWAVVLVFSCYSMCNAFQWIQYGSINNIFMNFYGVSAFAIDWLSMCYMLAYIPLLLPVAWLLEKFGLRTIALAGSARNCLGAWVKLGSLKPHLFPVTVLGQVICSVAQVFILGMPFCIASVWFRANKVSTACSIAVFGNQMAWNCPWFFIPPVLVPNIDIPDGLAYYMSILFCITAGVATLLFILVITVFKEKPKHPSSRAQSLRYTLASSDASYLNFIIRLFKNLNFLLLVITYGKMQMCPGVYLN